MNLFKLKPVAAIDLATLVRPKSPNTYFVCPVGFSTSEPDQIAPVYDQPPESLLEAWKTLAARQPKTVELETNAPKKLQVTHVQRTSLLGYPDVITAQIIPLPDDQSSLATYSRSQYGHSDLGANRKRITDWLAQLSAMLADKQH